MLFMSEFDISNTIDILHIIDKSTTILFLSKILNSTLEG